MNNDDNRSARYAGETDMTDKQLDIMNAVIEIFAQKGFAATTTSEIARRAGVGEGTIFHYYKTKFDLLLALPDYLNRSAVTREYMEEMIGLFDHPPERFEDFIRAVIRNRQKFMTHNIPLIKVLF